MFSVEMVIVIFNKYEWKKFGKKNENILKNYVYVYNIVFVEYVIWYNDLYNVNIDI